ncbi:App1 family protein [Spirosoma knui]
MDTLQPTSTATQNLSLKARLTRRLRYWLRLTDEPTVKLYRGYGNDARLTVQGTVFRRSALPRKNYRDSAIINLLGVLRLFLVAPHPHALVRINVAGYEADTQADADGYFRVEVPVTNPLAPGWHPVTASLISQTLATETVLARGEGQVLVPDPTQFICISDIDDTFLVSHSATIAKRLMVLLTQNAHSRQPFEGVVAHYQLLAQADSGPTMTNPFFYVSSSEWNLYDYILDFSLKNQLPNGVFMLSQLKRLGQVLKTGQNKHMTKFSRIVRIVEAFPDQQVILLGDDTQEDPTIYASVVEHFPKQIHCVYIRQVHRQNQPKTREILQRIEAVGVHCCYFAHSEEAKGHSVTIGLVPS